MQALPFLVYASVVTLMPALVVLWHHGAAASWAFIGGDAYLYLGIARNSPPEFYSFDGERPTNGFHPFWQYWVWLVTDWFRDSPGVVRNITAWSAILLVWVGAVLGGLAARRLSGSWALACLVTPGAYFLLIGQGVGGLAAWNFFNAMEAGLTFALAGVILLLAAQAGRWQDRALYWLALGVALAALVFARLDEAFVVLTIALALLLWPGRARGWLRGLHDGLLVGLPAAAMLGLYFAYNHAQMGLFMPISGSAKGEGALLSNGWVTALTLFSPMVELREGLTDYTADRTALRGAAFRVWQLFVPAGLAAVLALTLWQRFADRPWAPILAGACAGIILKAAYSFLFANYWHQAHWYFGFAMLTLSVTLAAVTGPALARLWQVVPGAARGVGVFLVAFGLLHSSHQSLRAGPEVVPGAERMQFWTDRAALEAQLRAAEPGIRLLDFGDGILGYSFGFVVRDGFVFAGDIDSLRALRASRLLRDSHADGFTVLASFEYLRAPPEATTWDSDAIRAYLADSHLDARVKAELELFDFEVIHRDAPTGVVFIRFTPRAEG